MLYSSGFGGLLCRVDRKDDDVDEDETINRVPTEFRPQMARVLDRLPLSEAIRESGTIGSSGVESAGCSTSMDDGKPKDEEGRWPDGSNKELTSAAISSSARTSSGN